MNLEEYKGVYIYAQQVDNVLTGISFELLGKARDLAKDLNTDVTAVLARFRCKGSLRTSWHSTVLTRLSL